MCSKYHICTILLTSAQARAKTDIALDLLSVAMTVNATFAQHLHLGAMIMGSHGFEGHLQMVQMWRQIYMFLWTIFAHYANNSTNLLFCTAFALEVIVCKPVILEALQMWAKYVIWTMFAWVIIGDQIFIICTRMLCIANVTKLIILNMFAHEANVSKPKL